MPKGQPVRCFFEIVMIPSLVFLLTSCNAAPSPHPTIAPRSEIPTLEFPTTPESSPTPAPTAIPFTDCQKMIDEQFPADFLTEGSLIFRRECTGVEGWHKLSAATRKIEPFLAPMDDLYPTFQVSNDRQWMAVEKYSRDANDMYLRSILIFTGEDDHSTIQYPMVWGWQGMGGWHKNGQFGISSWVEGSFTTFLLDPFTGKVSKFDYYQADANDAVPDPEMEYAVYLNHYYDRFTDYRLRNLKTGQVLWENPAAPEKGYANYPAWSPDGKYFATALWQEEEGSFKFMVVDRNGKETITSELFRLDGELTYGGIDFQLSSTGKYVTFWTKSDVDGNQLVLWMPATNQIIYPGMSTKSNLTYPDFSPDDQKFLIQSTDQHGQPVTFLVDLALGKTTTLHYDLPVVAWLKTNIAMAKSVANEPYPLMPKSGAAVKQIHPQGQALDVNFFRDGLVFFRDGFLYTMNLHGEQKIADTGLAYVSPNRKNLFYWDEDEDGKRSYWLYQLNGQTSEVITDQIHSEYAPDEIGGWQSDDELWVATRDERTGPLFNPFNNSFRSLPEFKQAGPEHQLCWVYCRGLGWPPAWLYTHYDKALERHLYIADALIMQDRLGNVLWRYEKGWVGFRMPKWSPDDQRMGVPLPTDDAHEHYEIFLVDRNGKQTQLTNYMKAYPTMLIDNFSWSPDGRYIAFWADTHSQENLAQQNPYRLFILDTITRQTTDYDLAGDYPNTYNAQPAPLWSPDGSQIAMNGMLDVSNGNRQMLILDIASETVTPIGDGQLIGWMTVK